MMSTINFYLLSRLRSAAIILLPYIRFQGGGSEKLPFYLTVGSNGGLCEHGAKKMDPNYQGCLAERRR
jgi:hypothetical protein